MPRPTKGRRVCSLPPADCFFPTKTKAENKEPVVLTVDEYETIRLLDSENYTQEDCAAAMRISRTTAQEIYARARKKIATALTRGRPLAISGGNYSLCDGQENNCACGGCEKHRRLRDAAAQKIIPKKGVKTMKIAVTYEKETGEVFAHFGHTESFKIYEVSNEPHAVAVTSSAVVDTNGSGHGALAGFLAAHNVDVLICGGIGGGAQMALTQAGIRFFGGASGSADDAVSALLAGHLVYDPDVHCHHHDHEGADHTCGDHGCGQHCGD